MKGLIKEKVNECLRLVRMSNRKVNEIRFGENESLVHQEMKKYLCNKLKSEGHYFVTEAIFETGGRADILVLDEFKAIEIAVTEDELSILNKRKVYPKGIEIEVVRCGICN